MSQGHASPPNSSEHPLALGFAITLTLGGALLTIALVTLLWMLRPQGGELARVGQPRPAQQPEAGMPGLVSGPQPAPPRDTATLAGVPAEAAGAVSPAQREEEPAAISPDTVVAAAAEAPAALPAEPALAEPPRQPARPPALLPRTGKRA